MIEPQQRIDRLCRLLALAVATAAFALRFKGVWFGYPPLAMHPDEGYLVYRALRIIQLGDLNPRFFNYPTLNLYLFAILFEGVALWNRLILGSPNVAGMPVMDFFIAARILVVFMSTATIYVTYEMGRRVIHPVAGLAAATLIAPAFLHVSNSFVATVDSSLALWSSLAVLMSVLIYADGARRHYYVLSGVFAGLALGSKYTGLLSVVPLIIAHLAVTKRNALLNKNFVLGLLAVPITFVLTTPYAVLDYESFRASVSFEQAHYSTGHAGAESSTGTSFLPYAKLLALDGYGVLPTLLFLGGVIWLSVKDYRMALILLGFPLSLFLFVGGYKVLFMRNLVAIVPFLALCGGILLYALLSWLKNWVSGRLSTFWGSVTAYGLVGILLCVSVSGQLVRSCRYIHLINLPDTRVASLLWITENLPPGSRIGREHYTPPVEKLTDDYEVVYLGYYGLTRFPQSVAHLDYVVLSSTDYDRFISSPEDYPREAELYQTFFAENQLVKEFVPDSVTLGGPTIRIYRVAR
jgi:4-amino-4-deoxy-L-arabinose transferase-like glycosyltransferase